METEVEVVRCAHGPRRWGRLTALEPRGHDATGEETNAKVLNGGSECEWGRAI